MQYLLWENKIEKTQAEDEEEEMIKEKNFFRFDIERIRQRDEKCIFFRDIALFTIR